MLNNSSLPVFVVSLARATERREAITQHLNSLNISHEIVNAVDGKNSDLSEYEDRLRHIGECEKRMGAMFDRGSIGCYLSHYQMWERIVHKNIPAAVILEDDAVLQPNFIQTASDVIACEWKWDVVLMHAEGRKGKMRKICSLNNGGELVQYMRHPYALIAYLVSLEGAKKLLEYCRDLRLPIDSHWKPWWQWNGLFYCVRPQVATANGSDSTIMQVAQETGGGKDGKFIRTPKNLFTVTSRSLTNKQERLAAYFYFHLRRPQKKWRRSESGIYKT